MKIHLAVDSYGLSVHFELSGGQVHDIVYAEKLINGMTVKSLEHRYEKKIQFQSFLGENTVK